MRVLPAAKPGKLFIGAVTVGVMAASGGAAVAVSAAVTSAAPVAAAAPAAQPGMHYGAKFKTSRNAARSGPSDIRAVLTAATCTGPDMHYGGCS